LGLGCTLRVVLSYCNFQHLAKGLIERADYDKRKEEILHPASAKPVTIEDRLKKLDDLIKKGLIAKPEYDKKRAEILSEM
jgi:hypothetical protein